MPNAPAVLLMATAFITTLTDIPEKALHGVLSSYTIQTEIAYSHLFSPAGQIFKHI